MPAKTTAALLFAMTYPTLLTWVYFALLKDSPGSWQQAAFAVGKVIQFAFPAIWVFAVQRRRLRLQRPSWRGLKWGLLLGLFEIIAGLALYFLLLKPAGVFAEPAGEMLDKVRSFGVDFHAGFIAMGVGYSLVHSGMEEYYWRWFVLGELAGTQQHEQRKNILAIVISSLAFAAHHVIVLAGFFHWDSPWTYLLSAVVAIGGGLFGWLYLYSKSLYPPWLAHAFADAVIFAIGYDLLAGSLR